MVTKEEYLARRSSGPHCYDVRTAADAAFMRKLGEDSRRRNCSLIEVCFDAGLDAGDFRVYVDRYIVGLGAMDSELAVPGNILGRIEPGERSVILRDRDPRKPGRRESNLMVIKVAPHQRVTLRASLCDGALHLAFLGASGFPPSVFLTDVQ